VLKTEHFSGVKPRVKVISKDPPLKRARLLEGLPKKIPRLTGTKGTLQKTNTGGKEKRGGQHEAEGKCVRQCCDIRGNGESPREEIEGKKKKLGTRKFFVE